ncbi:transglutaminase TgpA family protein [Marinobacterium arenosum]|uniref:transglutaminase TgpA family protein n=1 Tax=Marinobacterium arenosum TaxID=2862496 RepID=UPI001C9479BE|nr:DUF3488 and transglutaminase-like domain-containing protein [Marinobacterium arenosum]MBY4676293.1 DUF3488 and transglutaminase-like domain-containing protein [Marinobacterium arenosum]
MNPYQLSRPALNWLLASIALVLLPLIGRVPGWLLALAAVCIAWRLLIHQGRLSYPHWSVRVLLLLGCSAGILVSFRGQIGVETAVALLVLGFLLKLLEMYQRRDALLVVYLAYLVAALALLFNQSIPLAIYQLVVLAVISTALRSVYQGSRVDGWRPLWQVLRLFGQALPITLVLFLLVPRVEPFWQLSWQQGNATTGLAEQVAPGDVARLTRSADRAFQARFDGTVPAQTQLYWRAMTLSQFDGRRWRLADGYRDQGTQQGPSAVGAAAAIERERAPLNYELILEPTGQRYMPSLALPVTFAGTLKRRQDGTLQLQNELLQRRQFALGSQLGRNLQDLPRPQDSALPQGSNPRSQAYARQLWQRSERNPQTYLQAILQLYHDRFSYTLRPPPLPGESVDQFLFDTRQGFCGHFASATAVLLRAVGIPARLVSGYQGGEWNPYEGYLTVRQYDAHAWLEAWLPPAGWVMVDPTAAVAPERVERSAEQLFARDEQFLADSPFSPMRWRGEWLNRLRMRWEAVNYSWQRWVLNYHQRQSGLFRDWLGANQLSRAVLLTTFLLGVLLALVACWLLRRNRPVPLHPCDRAFVRLQAQLAKRGLPRRPDESVSAFCQRLQQHYPEQSEQWRRLAEQYTRYRYAGEGSTEQLCVLIERCRRRLA